MGAAEVEKELENMRRYTQMLTSYTEDLRKRAGDRKLDEFCEKRKFSREVVDKQKIFYIGDATEMLLPRYIENVDNLGIISPANKKPIFHDRYVMPIMDVHGNVLNMVGYSGEANERYVYGTAKYYRRTDTLYGLESLNLAYEMGYAILTEGITDTIMLRNIGYPNTYARCGTHGSDFMMRQLDRCRHGVIKVPDRDEAGRTALRKWKCNRSIILNVFIKYKDIDEMCRDSEDNIAWVKEYMDACISKIKQREHNGYFCGVQELTMF